MRITICRGQNSSLVRVEQGGRVRYFNAGRYLSDKRIVTMAKSAGVTLRNDIEPEHVHTNRERYERGGERRDGLRLQG